ncbi:hypothetical protein PQO03_02265 [Lentisphaera profundi]|uniref:Uncharacterized protein n=1 Tax=Lentisphaera profundi TaxID=1658616 RepID=A0ABY7VSR4_9BACT|nr:hypothetical protein [Lentisphaera profundi]WDE96784.1 hypothetical protein PQO03_02265 [Lentisphaera profundi]
MILIHKNGTRIKLYSEESLTTLDDSPVLHICTEDGANSSEMKARLDKMLSQKLEWYIAYGPDALLWCQKAELLKISEIEQEPESEYKFSTFSFDDEQDLSMALHQLTSFSSASNNNQVYKEFIVISDSIEETKLCLGVLGYQTLL